MQIILKTVVAAGALALASTSALAQIVVPEQPATNGFNDGGVGGNSSLVVAAWDHVRGVSLVQNLGLYHSDTMQFSDWTTPGTSLDFGTLGRWDEVFGASNAADIRYQLASWDSEGSGVSGKSISVTFSAETFEYTNANHIMISNAAGKAFQFAGLWFNGASGCAGENPCVALDNLQGQYIDGRFMNLGIVPTAMHTEVGSALHFAHAATRNAVPTQQGEVTVFMDEETGNWGEWLLTTGGNLSWTVAGTTAPVPLPAAAWLLLSGLGGMGLISRRRKVA